VLGPLQALEGGRQVVLGTQKQQTVLALLLLNANNVVPSDRLVDELWGESSPPTARKAVQVYISQLRKLLDANGDERIATRSGGYALSVGPGALDAYRFEALVSEARALVSAGEVAAGADAYRNALSLWRGPVLAGLPLEQRARGEADRLEEERLTATAELIDCELALGRHERAIGQLERLVAEHPLSERFRGQLMLALYRSGRQADALRVYREGRTTLREELGLEPGVPLQRLERGILTQDEALEAPAGIADSGPIPSAPPESPVAGAGRSRWGGRRAVLALAALVAAGILAAALALVLRPGHSGLTAIGPNAVGLVDPRTNAIVTRFSVDAPASLVARGSLVWVADEADKSVDRIDSSRLQMRTLAIPGHPSALAVGSGVIWVANGAEQTVVQIHTTGGYAGAPVRLASVPPEARALGIAASGGGAWVASPGTRIFRVDRGGRVNLRRFIPSGVVPAIASGAGRVWVGGSGSVTPIDPDNGVPGAPVAVECDPAAVASGSGSVWVACGSDVQRVDEGRQVVTATVHVGRNASAIAVGRGAVWVANASDGTVSRIDPARNDVVRTIHVGGSPAALALGSAGLWVAVR